jgi:hypothetical protein
MAKKSFLFRELPGKIVAIENGYPRTVPEVKWLKL